MWRQLASGVGAGELGGEGRARIRDGSRRQGGDGLDGDGLAATADGDSWTAAVWIAAVWAAAAGAPGAAARAGSPGSSRGVASLSTGTEGKRKYFWASC